MCSLTLALNSLIDHHPQTSCSPAAVYGCRRLPERAGPPVGQAGGVRKCRHHWFDVYDGLFTMHVRLRHGSVGAVFGEALDLPIKVVAASEIKPAATKFIKNNWRHRVPHCFDDMICLGKDGGSCSMHGDGVCTIGKLSIVDCFCTGMPCQPWTRFRTRDAKSCAAAEHPGWNVTFVSFFSVLDSATVKINGGISENVLGFADEDTRSGAALQGHKSPYHLFKAELRRRGYSTTTLLLSASVWLEEPPRDRLYVVWLNDALGGAEACRWIKRTVQDFARTSKSHILCFHPPCSPTTAVPKSGSPRDHGSLLLGRGLVVEISTRPDCIVNITCSRGCAR
jgi:hypothetical protein